MAKNKQYILQELKSKPLAYTLQAVGIVIILLNMWLATKLYPLAKTIDTVNAQVETLKNQVSGLQISEGEHGTMETELKVLGTKIDDAVARITRIDDRLSKHLGI